MKRSLDDHVKATISIVNIMLRPRFLWPGLLVIVFLVSAGTSLTLPYRRPSVIWFPSSRSVQGSRSNAELRYVPVGHGTAEEAAAIVEELLLGPLGASSRPMSVPYANIRSVIRSDRKLYVDVSSEILFGRLTAAGIVETPPLPPRIALSYIERTLRWNFPFFTAIITVDGLEPVWNTPEKAPGA
ncbi:MAG: hypothetical protein CVV51_07960 [Spirochaetae bacterium HGW-Spirochaetae-7]|jgi:hypothetical protein|nr:MAG: hypothetical protein CVV51_07960 [Spirochaetae bacterium HGW-Spirochaetae-7]